MDDLISRQAAIDAVIKRDANCGIDSAEVLKALPSAQPKRKKGKWNWVSFNIECSECGAMPNFDSTEPLYNFCPNCGADMRGDENDN